MILPPHKPAQFLPLGDVFETRNGYTPPKADPANWEGGTAPWFRMEDIRGNGRILDHAVQRVFPSAVKGGRLFPAGSVIMSTTATIGEHALIMVPALANQRFTALWPRREYAGRLLPRFVFYYCFVLAEWCLRNTRTSSFSSVDMEGFRCFPFPVPSLGVQEEIVGVLDRFTALEGELAGKLEGELAARRKQYEYYRNQLLSFSESCPPLPRIRGNVSLLLAA